MLEDQGPEFGGIEVGRPKSEVWVGRSWMLEDQGPEFG